MTETIPRAAKSTVRDAARRSESGGAVLQVETRDFVDLVPVGRPRAHSLRGFDAEYTDIVDYIVRCTHRIWDERDVGLIYTHYTHNCTVYSSLGTVSNREDVVQGTIQRIAELPDRRGMATQVIWGGDDEEGFYTSHLVTSSGRHTEAGPYGPPTRKSFTFRTIADCMILENKIYREWLVRDTISLLRQIGVDPHPIAEGFAAGQYAKGVRPEPWGETGRLLGQYLPETKADLSLAATDTERKLLQALHDIHNRRLYGTIRALYAPTVVWHGPGTKDLRGTAAVMAQTFRLAATIADLAFVVDHVCSNPCVEGGEKVAVRWTMHGHHLGHGFLGAPTGYPLTVMGLSHYHVIDGRIVEEWTLYDELALLTQIKLGALVAAEGASHRPGQGVSAY